MQQKSEFSGDCEPVLGQAASQPGVQSYGISPQQPVIRQPMPSYRRFDAGTLDSASKLVYHSISTFHKSGARLHTCMNDVGTRLLQSLDATSAAEQGHLTFEDLLTSLAHDDEHVLTNDWRLLYTRVTIYDCEKEGTVVLEELPSGAAILTNKRLLLLSASAGQGMTLTAMNEKKANRMYELTGANLDNIIYKPLPLKGVASVEMSATTGAKMSALFSAQRPCCCGLCPCFSCCCESARKQWRGMVGPSTTHNMRVIRIGLRLPPWDRRTIATIELRQDLPLTVARDFIVLLQRHSPISGNL